MSKVLAIGDIHTKLWIIDKVRAIADNYDKVIFVGDYADDWGKEPIDSINTWKELRSLSHSNPNVKLVIGNHDYIYLNETSSIASGYNTGTQFLLDLPDNKELKDWLKTIPVKLEVDNVTYSHAGYNTDWDEKNDLWRDDSPIWIRPDAIPYGWEFKPNQVFGHTPSHTCWELPTNENVWCIDTFSTYPDGKPIGDETVLEITDGKKFTARKLNEI